MWPMGPGTRVPSQACSFYSIQDIDVACDCCKFNFDWLAHGAFSHAGSGSKRYNRSEQMGVLAAILWKVPR